MAVNELERRLDAAVDRALTENRIVGAVVLVAHRGVVIYSRAAGFANRETRAAMRHDAIFLLASVTKPIVTATAMRLIESGRLGLEDCVARWLPRFRPRLADGSTPNITVRHLLTHTAGLSYRSFEPPESPYHALEVSDGLDQPGLSFGENLQRLAQAPLLYEPGTAWRYSLATDVLGGVVAAASEQSLPEAVRNLVTGPFGMLETDFAVVDRARLATPYADSTPEPARIANGMAVPLFGAPVTFSPDRIFDPSSYPSGGAGMAGTAADVLRFLEAVRAQRDGVLRASTLRQMMTPHVGAEAQTWGPGWGFGFGWAVLEDPASAGTPQSKGTLQWGGVYGHSWFVDPQRSLTVVVLTNTAFEGMTGTLPVDIRNTIYEFLPE